MCLDPSVQEGLIVCVCCTSKEQKVSYRRYA